MGRERYWGGRSTKKGRGGRGGGREEEERDNPPGCMSAVFQYFDFHQFQLCNLHQQQPPFKPNSFLPEEPTILKGVEAPRNSLESEEAFMGAASLSPVISEEENLNIPMGIQIKTSTTGETRPKVAAASNDLSSESSYSPGTKTPNLVARLMGLDLLPDHNHSPSSSSYSCPIGKSHLLHIHSQQPYQCPLVNRRINRIDNDLIGTRSLPETPRISSARRSDVDHHHHHRLSLQINKENASVSEELMGKRKEIKVQSHENVSPSHYARQIVQQAREKVGRKVGLDITNTMRNKEQRRDEHVMAIKSKKYSKVFTKVGDDELIHGKNSITTSSSPRLRFLEPKNNTSHSLKPSSSSSSSSSSPLDDNQPPLAKALSKPKSPPPLQEQQKKSMQKCKKNIAGEPIRTTRNNQEESFVRPSVATRAKNSDKKCKKTPLISSNGLPVKKDPSPPATKLPQKQSQVAHAQALKNSSELQLSSCSSQMCKQEATRILTTREKKDGYKPTTKGGDAAEFQYVTRILKGTGIEKDTQVSFSRWFSPFHPLDPSIFHHLEHSFIISTAVTITTTTTTTTTAGGSEMGQLSHRCNRKLIFHLIDEILVEILKPYINMKPWVCSPSIHHDYQMKGSQLVEKLCTKIRSFPSSNCQVLQDIDALIDEDLHEPPNKHQTTATVAFEEEGEAIVLDIEKDIVDSLVHETAAFWCGNSVQKIGA